MISTPRPRPGPDGDRLAWLYWDHPNMPWDGCRLTVADLDFSGPVPAVGPPAEVAGGDEESVGQPVWGPDGRLFFVSDRHGWWQPFCLESGAAETNRLADEEADFHGPDWVLGQSTLVPLADGRLVCRVRREGTDAVVVVDGAARGLGGVTVEVVQPCVSISAIRAAAGGKALALIGATADEPAAVPHGLTDTGVVGVGRAPSGRHGARRLVGEPSPVDRDVSDRHPRTLLRTASTRSGRPRRDGAAFGGGVPQGGPQPRPRPASTCPFSSGPASGVAVAVVDYRGSSGHGRAYRRALDGGWGLFDADVRGGRPALADIGLAERDRMVVKEDERGRADRIALLAPGGPFAGAVVAYG